MGLENQNTMGNASHSPFSWGFKTTTQTQPTAGSSSTDFQQAKAQFVQEAKGFDSMAFTDEKLSSEHSSDTTAKAVRKCSAETMPDDADYKELLGDSTTTHQYSCPAFYALYPRTPTTARSRWRPTGKRPTGGP